MTQADTLRDIANMIRAQLTQLDPGPTTALRMQAQRLDRAAVYANRYEDIRETVAAYPLHPVCVA